jgi:uncharacterized protein YceH (UPF0502 family)
LRARSGRLHSFADNNEVVVAVNGLIERDGEPMLINLPRTPGRKDSEYMHLFCGPIDMDAYASAAQSAKASPSSNRTNVADLEERVSYLEAEVKRLKTLLDQEIT